MLTTYDRIMRNRRKLTQLQVKQLEERLARTDAPGVSEDLIVPGVHVAQLMAKAAKTAAIALFSLAFTVGCATPMQPWYERAETVQPAQLPVQP